MKKSLIFLQVSLLLVLAQFGTDIYLPSMPAMMADLDASAFVIKLSITLMIIGLGLSQLYYGPASDAYGRRKMLLLSLGIFVVGSVIIVAYPSVNMLLIGRCLQGLGIGFGLCASSIVACDLYQGAALQRALSIVSIVYAVTPVIAPVTGGFLQTYVNWQANFWVLLGLGVVMLGVIWRYFPETNANKISHFSLSSVITSYGRFFNNRIFFGNLLVLSFFYAGEVAYTIQMPLIVQGQFLVTPLLTGWLVLGTSVGIALGGVAVIAMSNRHMSPNKAIMLGLICAILCPISWFLLLGMGYYNVWILVGPAMLFALGAGITFPSVMTNCITLYPKEAGAVSALTVGLLTFLGGLFSFYAAKLPVFERYALPSFMLFVCVCMFLAFWLSLTVRKKKSFQAIGLMSGTSMDGVDAAWIETDGEQNIQLRGYFSLSYDPSFYAMMKVVEKQQGKHCTPEMIQKIDDWHYNAVLGLLKKYDLKSSDIDIIGYHGQTVYHQPAEKISIQLGDPAALANRLGISVMGHVRQNDVQSGGQGAPVAPVYHQALIMRDKLAPAMVINCGGITNITLVIGPETGDVWGFDAGPGNGLLDRWVYEKTQGRECMDKDGQYGLQGKIHDEWLTTLYETSCINQHGENYYDKKPPKSLDIRDFHWPIGFDALSLEDGCATLAAFTVQCIAKSLQWMPNHDLRYVILVGGGWYNPCIRQQLEKALSAQTIVRGDDIGWSAHYMEAELMAFLAVRRLKDLPVTFPTTTGVASPLIGGEIFTP